MENWVIFITNQTFCDEGVNKVLIAILSNTGCLVLSLAFDFPISHFICK